jgi:hypothetical protein
MAVAGGIDEEHIVHGGGTAGVGDGDFAPRAKQGDEIGIDAAAEAFDIGGVDEELGAMGSERVERGMGERQVSEGLPAVHGHGPPGWGAAAGKIDDQFVGTDGSDERVQSIGEKVAAGIKQR